MNRKFTIKAFCLSLLTLSMALLAAPKANAQVDPCTQLSCIGHINAAIDTSGCAAVITVDMALNAVTDATACPNLAIEITGNPDDSIRVPGVYEYKVVDAAAGNECWGTVTVEDKTAPFLTCPRDVTISCADPSDPVSVAEAIEEEDDMVLINSFDAAFILEDNGEENALLWGLEVVECSPFNLDFRDTEIDGGCDGDTIRRTFMAIDATNRTSSCTQQIYLEPQDIDDISLPDDYDCDEELEGEPACMDRVESYGTVARVFALSCDGAGTEWAMLENGLPAPDDKMQGDSIIPGTGRVGGIDCGTIQAAYEDVIVPICEEPGMECAQSSPSFKVVRQWKILDWCSGAIIDHNQIIKVLDDEAPMIVEELPDVTIGTTLWDCSAELVLPRGEVTDNCSTEIRAEYSSTDGTITDGVLYLADNAKTMAGGDTVMVMVDYYDCCGNSVSDTFAVVVIDDIPPVPVADFHTTVALSDYEFADNSGLAKVFAESFDDGSFDNCGPVSIGVRRIGGTCSGYSAEDDAGKFYEFIHFCCRDVGNTVMVEFRVCDDADMDGSFGGTLGQVKPDPLEDISFSGDDDDNCNFAMIEVEVQDKLPPACAVPDDVSIDCIDFAALGDIDRIRERDMDDLFGEARGGGPCDVDIDQELMATEDCGLGEIIRTVTVTNPTTGLFSTCTQTITVTVDSSVNFLVCGDISFPQNSPEQQAFNAAGVADVWCLTNPTEIGDPINDEIQEDLPAIETMMCEGVNITAPVIDITNLCSEVGINLTLDTFDFAGGGCKKILAHWEIIDQCIFDENFILDGEIDPFVVENGYFELYVEYDLFDTEGPVITCMTGFDAECDAALVGSITATATDDCTTDASFFGWNWQLDQDGDGTVDAEGEGNSITPADLDREDFPVGNHIVTWIVSDGCGNLSSMDCPVDFGVVDSKEPTPYCFDGLSTAVMEVGGVTLWAEDFNAGSFDNCGDVFVTIVPESDVEGLSDAEAYAASLVLVMNVETGKEEYGWVFDCDDIANGVSAVIDVRMYATDEAGNYDYCTASLRLQDNLDACTDTDGLFADIGGNVATVDNQMVSEVQVVAMAANPEFPKFTETDENGNYAFFGNQVGLDYEITSERTNDYRNGVTTLDLVMIQKYILNLGELNSPYKLIAADINGDESIKATDLLQLRKLILGLYQNDVLPSNDSWKFVAKDYQFADTNSPWPFEEVVSIEGLTEDMVSQDFVAIKVGDLNGSVNANAKSGAVVRNAKNVSLAVQDASYENGEQLRIDFTSADFEGVYGYQFTLEFAKGLDFVRFESGKLDVSDANFALNRLDEGIITTSYDDVRGVSASADEVLFSLVFDANTAGTIAESIEVSSKIAKAEIYLGENLEVADLSLRTNELEVGGTFELYQNEPNPFKEVTNISFNLPEAGKVNLQVFDVAGKLILSQTRNFDAGVQTMKVSLEASGVMYYQLTAGEYSATKKMIVIE